ncbi:MAG TPA: choice-of-anchor D domain-containing protein [Candidatus Krumholzibacteria bacterium]|nr:choice-of-anchor D domain-containing protein [Candidatus Krumholzibacteria bacterium]
MLLALDGVAPAPVTDLAISTTTSNTVFVAWTASGDDGVAGTAARYDLRYSTAPIDAGNFEAATPVAGIPAPRPSGTPESVEVTGLDFDTTYYFALVVEDELTNRSPVSNPASGTTLGAPGLAFAPDTFSADVLTGGRSTHSLTIKNTAQGTLDFFFDDAPSWLRTDPLSGRVYAGESLVVDVVFDATRVFGGEYRETVVLHSNDPVGPESPIELVLRVTDAPDIAAVPSEIDFGVRYTGTCATDTVLVSNIGSEALTVDAVAVNNPEFTVDTGGFVLGVGESRPLAVTFCPVVFEAGGPIRFPRRSRGVLSMTSNDPDHPRYAVPLFGEGIEPPVIAVAPASFDEELFTGASATHTLTIGNDGATELDFEIVLEETGGVRVEVIADPSLDAGVKAVGRPLSPGELAALTASVPKRVDMRADEHLDRDARAVTRTSGARMLERISAGNLEEVFGSDQNEFLGGPRTRGNLFTCTTATTLREHRFYMNPTTATQVWFVVYEGATQDGVYDLVSASDVTPAGPGLGWYSSGEIAVPLRAGKFYLIATAFEDAASYYNEQGIAPYPITTSFGELTAGAGWSWEPYDQFPPAPFQFVTTGAFGEPVAYYQTLVTGGAVRWVSVDEAAQTLPPGISIDVPLRFDASGMQGGEYAADVRVTSNDPVNPEVVVPVNLRVVKAPDIAISRTRIDFGSAFVGTTAYDTLFVSNPGTDFLFVSATASSRPEYAVDAPVFVLGPGTRKLIVVSFAPTTAGSLPATLSLTTNDPDQALVQIALAGEAREAPVLAIEPPSFLVDLASGEAASPVLVLTNSGGGELTYEIDTGLRPRPALSKRPPFPRRAADFPRGSHPASIGPAPRAGRSDPPAASVPATSTAVAFSTETQNRRAARLRLDSPETLHLVGNAPDFIWAGDFGVGDNSFAYAVNELNQFMTIDTLTGTQALLGSLVPFGTEVWTGMALDPTTGTLYAASTNVQQSSLYVVDVAVPRATRVGAIGFPGIISLAVDDDGRMFAQDVITDELVSVEKSTGVGTAIGSLGFDSNFGQGMAFDPVGEELYISAFNNFRFQSELRVADRTTGATSVVGVIGALEPGGLAQLGWLGIPGLGGVPWLRASPRRGVVPPGQSVEVAVAFDAASLNGGDYDASLRITTDDPATPEITVLARLHVTGVPDIAASDSLLDYGVVFIGGRAKKTLVVSNVGTDVLNVSGVSVTGDFAVDGSAFALAPGEDRELVVSLAPASAGSMLATLVIASNDADEGSFDVALRGEGREPPVMSIGPASFAENLFTGQSVTRAMTIDNSAGAADLIWNASTRYPGDARTVVATSPVHRSRPIPDPLKEAGLPPARRPDPGGVYSFAPVALARAHPVDATSLESILASLDTLAGDVTATIPDRFDFFDGAVSDGILDGGYDMYDGGNYLATNFGGFIPYSDGVIVDSPRFGAGGRYFTRKYPGLFVLVAEMDNVEYFEIDGNLGADGGGSVDGAVLHARTAGADFLGFVKRVYGAGDPSVNHMIIVQENEGASHEFSTDTNRDYHRAFGLSGSRRLYYLLYAGWDGAYIDNTAALTVMTTFLNSLGLSPQWVRVTPAAGAVPAGESRVVDVVFDAARLVGDYVADIVVAGNDPVTPEVAVPTGVHVDSAPDVALSTHLLRFDPIFVGAASQERFTISNAGSEVLTVSAIASSAADFAADVSSTVLAPGESDGVAVTFAPLATGLRYASLSITSDDPDEATVVVVLVGEGVEAPVVAVEPVSLADTLVAGDSSTHTLTVSNQGGTALDLRVTVEGGRAGTPPATPMIVTGGGPDYFGYRWQDTHDAGGPAFEWIDASGGTDVALADDGFVEGIPLGFSFRYYGRTYTEIGVGANGWLSFNGSFPAFPASVPLADFCAGAIAPYARDLAPTMGAYVRHATIGTAPDRRFVIEYNQVPDAGGENPKTFQAILDERTGAIRFQYLAAPNAPEGLGIESPDESVGLGDGGAGDTFIDPARVVDGYAIEFIAPPTWLTIAPTEASLPSGAGADFVVTMDAAGLAGGEYHARLSIRSNDPVTPVVSIPVGLVVGAPLSVAGTGARGVPTRFALHPNRPNPFNPVTTIAYDLPRASRVRLAIYDVRGREVRALIDANQPSGSHEVRWDGRDARGVPAASGVYFYRLSAGDFVQTKKMVLLK